MRRRNMQTVLPKPVEIVPQNPETQVEIRNLPGTRMVTNSFGEIEVYLSGLKSDFCPRLGEIKQWRPEKQVNVCGVTRLPGYVKLVRTKDGVLRLTPETSALYVQPAPAGYTLIYYAEFGHYVRERTCDVEVLA
jgi:hypothetical protein